MNWCERSGWKKSEKMVQNNNKYDLDKTKGVNKRLIREQIENYTKKYIIETKFDCLTIYSACPYGSF